MARLSVKRGVAGDVEPVLDLWEEMMAVHARLDCRFCPTADARQLFRPVLLAWLRDPDYRVFVAREGHRMVGYLIARVSENPPMFEPRHFGHISDTCVAPDRRRLGIGRRLFAAARSWLRRRGLTVLKLNVAASNPVSQQFWRKMGFSDYMHRMWLDI
jgi:ribosomal protein S18 acetylase RimI-like enzyme